jgi:Tfp pilus assembly protein PilF
LARIHLRQKKNAMFLSDLAMIASFDADNIEVRRTLAERYLTEGNGAMAEKWATECLHINVYDPVIHVLLADAQLLEKKFKDAALEYQTALVLKPKRPDDVKVKLAKSQFGAGQRDAAKATLDEVLKGDPEHPEGKALKGEMEKGKSG